MATENALVHVATAGDTGEASVMRSYLEHHEVNVFVSGESSHSVMGMVGGFVELRIMVPAHQADQAKELLAEYENGSEEEEGPEHRGPFRDEFEDEDEDESMDDQRSDASRMRAKRVAIGAALIMPFGGGHLVSGAILRGFLLGGVSMFSVMHAGDEPAYFALWGVSVAVDIYGALERVSSARKTASTKS